MSPGMLAAMVSWISGFCAWLIDTSGARLRAEADHRELALVVEASVGAIVSIIFVTAVIGTICPLLERT